MSDPSSNTFDMVIDVRDFEEVINKIMRQILQKDHTIQPGYAQASAVILACHSLIGVLITQLRTIQRAERLHPATLKILAAILELSVSIEIQALEITIAEGERSGAPEAVLEGLRNVVAEKRQKLAAGLDGSGPVFVKASESGPAEEMNKLLSRREALRAFEALTSDDEKLTKN